jgi:predicted O-methyltransferase YrrM
MESVASQIERALTIPGWMSREELIWLATQSSEFSRIVEFGSFQGRSTRAMADNTSGTIWAVDPWNGDYPGNFGEPVAINTYVFPEFKKNLEDHILSGRVIPVRGFSTGFSLPHQVDMVFIDGDHRYKEVVKDINKAQEMVRLGGIISGHDYNSEGWPDVTRAVHDTLGKVSVEDSIWWTQKS